LGRLRKWLKVGEWEFKTEGGGVRADAPTVFVVGRTVPGWNIRNAPEESDCRGGMPGTGALRGIDPTQGQGAAEPETGAVRDQPSLPAIRTTAAAPRAALYDQV